MRARWALLGGLLALGVTGCQTPDPVTRYSVVAAETAPAPIAVTVAVTTEPRTGPKINQLGGEIPDAKPTTPVSDGGLGEIR